jgi:phosphocarrier protein
MISKKIALINKLGLHARAASKLVAVAQGYSSEISIELDDKNANAKSIMSLLVLAAPYESELMLTVDGEDEQEAHDAIVALIDNRFGEEE